IENFELPKSLVTKIAKSAIPDNAKLQKETVLSLVKGSTVFINYLGVCSAHDVALSKQHKSISASDVLKALEMIEFGDLVEKLQEELQ
ncbi:histone-fold-containing protein, partial [Pisolithus croceorrhizus]